MTPSGEFVNDVSGLAEVFVVVGEVHLWPDQAQVQLVVDPALPEPGVEEGSLVAGIGANKQDLWVLWYAMIDDNFAQFRWKC